MPRHLGLMPPGTWVWGPVAGYLSLGTLASDSNTRRER